MSQRDETPTMTREERRRATADVEPYKALRIVDVDVHPETSTGLLAPIFDYMPEGWRRRFEMKGAGGALTKTIRTSFPTGSALRDDAKPAPDRLPCSDPVFAAKDHLDRHGIASAILCSTQAGLAVSPVSGLEEGTVIASAYNDYFLEHWCAVDPRYRLAIIVSARDPEGAAKEIHRLAGNPAVAAVFLPLSATGIGHPSFAPVYAAAVEHGLPIYLHPTGENSLYYGAPSHGVMPDSFSERRAGYPLYAIPNLINAIFSRTFQRFPELRFAVVELGFTWVPLFMWRMDQTWSSNRIETPWITEPPSELVRRHFRFSTQPLDEPPKAAYLAQLVEMIGTDLLLFSSDYPHYDADEPLSSGLRLTDEQTTAVFQTNAETWFRL